MLPNFANILDMYVKFNAKIQWIYGIDTITATLYCIWFIEKKFNIARKFF